MKLREKIIGAVGVLVLSLVFLISGHFINKRENRVYEQIFNKDSEQSIFIESSKNQSTEMTDYKINSEKNEKNDEKSNVGKKIIVDIKGAVRKPKEYELSEGARIRDLIQAAGGLTEEADENTIHFSKILQDEECVIIHKIGEQNQIDLAVPLGSDFKINTESKKININKASIEELSTLYGVGEVKAKAIIEYREKNGGFKSIEDLGNVDGIGSKTVDKLRDKVDIK
jgi:competence protein ComEA